jgi:hypothetical protein
MYNNQCIIWCDNQSRILDVEYETAQEITYYTRRGTTNFFCIFSEKKDKMHRIKRFLFYINCDILYWSLMFILY